MHTKLIPLYSLALFLTIPGFGQTIQQNVEKQRNNPQRAEQAARADVYILPRTITNDTLPPHSKIPVQPGHKKKKKQRSQRAQ